MMTKSYLRQDAVSSLFINHCRYFDKKPETQLEGAHCCNLMVAGASHVAYPMTNPTPFLECTILLLD